MRLLAMNSVSLGNGTQASLSSSGSPRSVHPQAAVLRYPVNDIAAVALLPVLANPGHPLMFNFFRPEDEPRISEPVLSSEAANQPRLPTSGFFYNATR